MASYCLDTPVFDFALPRRKRRAPLDAVIAVRANGVATVNQVHGRPTAHPALARGRTPLPGGATMLSLTQRVLTYSFIDRPPRQSARDRHVERGRRAAHADRRAARVGRRVVQGPRVRRRARRLLRLRIADLLAARSAMGPRSRRQVALAAAARRRAVRFAAVRDVAMAERAVGAGAREPGAARDAAARASARRRRRAARRGAHARQRESGRDRAGAVGHAARVALHCAGQQRREQRGRRARENARRLRRRRILAAADAESDHAAGRESNRRGVGFAWRGAGVPSGGDRHDAAARHRSRARRAHADQDPADTETADHAACAKAGRSPHGQRRANRGQDDPVGGERHAGHRVDQDDPLRAACERHRAARRADEREQSVGARGAASARLLLHDPARDRAVLPGARRLRERRDLLPAGGGLRVHQHDDGRPVRLGRTRGTLSRMGRQPVSAGRPRGRDERLRQGRHAGQPGRARDGALSDRGPRGRCKARDRAATAARDARANRHGRRVGGRRRHRDRAPRGLREARADRRGARLLGQLRGGRADLVVQLPAAGGDQFRAARAAGGEPGHQLLEPGRPGDAYPHRAREPGFRRRTARSTPRSNSSPSRKRRRTRIRRASRSRRRARRTPRRMLRSTARSTAR